jgi:hypothetical protein
MGIFSSPHNLSEITPESMNFVVLSDVKDKPIFKGMEIDYTVSPLLGIPMKWKTIISQVEDYKALQTFRKKVPTSTGIIFMNLFLMSMVYL